MYKDEEEDDDEICMALAQSQAENEAEFERATLQKLLEEEDLEKAISESQASFQSERETPLCLSDQFRIRQEEIYEVRVLFQ